MDDGSSDRSDAACIHHAFSLGAEACVLLLRTHPHLHQRLVTSLLRDAHQLSHDDILRIFCLAVFGHEPSQAVEHLRLLKPAGYCGHVFVDNELSYKCVRALVLLQLLSSSARRATCVTCVTCDQLMHRRCYDCAADATCVVCADCFHGGNHSGHRYIMCRTAPLSSSRSPIVTLVDAGTRPRLVAAATAATSRRGRRRDSARTRARNPACT